MVYKVIRVFKGNSYLYEYECKRVDGKPKKFFVRYLGAVSPKYNTSTSKVRGTSTSKVRGTSTSKVRGTSTSKVRGTSANWLKRLTSMFRW